MCKAGSSDSWSREGTEAIPVTEAVGMVLAHDITEIRAEEFKGRAFRKGHIVREEDVCRLQKLGKERLFVLRIEDDEMHEDDAAYALAGALAGEGAEAGGGPKEGKINLIAARDGLLKVDREALFAFNLLGEVMCATLHDNTVVRKGQLIGGTRAIPLVVKKAVVGKAVSIASESGGIIRVKAMRMPRAGVVITGNEVFTGKVQDAFAPVIRRKMEELGGEIVGIRYAPDDEKCIEAGLRELIGRGADLLITTGGMSVDPDDVTRFAIRNMGAEEITYGSAVLPGSMILVAYLEGSRESQVTSHESRDNNSGGSSLIPVVGVPACGMYHKTTVFDLVLPRILAGEVIGRRELAELGHGGLCLNCPECRYPVCPFGK